MYNRSIRVTIALVFAALMLVGGLSAAASLRATQAQQHDALVINLAGRQRMLSQKMAKEAWLGLQKGQDSDRLAEMHTTADQFEEGLQALMDGGQLTYAGTTVSPHPATDPAFRAALEEVRATWKPLHRAAHGVLEGEPGSPAFIRAVADLERLSSVILEKMDVAVRAYQVAAETRVARVRWLQLAFLLTEGMVLALGFGLVLRQVLRPVRALETAVRRMEQGDLDSPTRVRGRNELGRLAQAFDDMRAEIKARIEEASKLRNAVQQTADIVFITDHDGIIEYVNPAFEEVTGYSKEEAIGRTPGILKSGLMEPEYYERLWSTILSGEVFRGEVINRRKDGELFYYDQVITPLKDAHGNITHFISTGRDTTERKRAEEALRHHRDTLAVRNRILSATLRTRDLDRLLNLILDEVLVALQVELGAIHLVQGDEVVLRCWRGLSDAFRAQVLSFPADDPPEYFRQSFVVHEWLSEQEMTPDFAKREGIQAWASFPLELPSPREGEEGEWLGVLMLGSRRHEALRQDQVQALEAMVNQLALAVAHARAYRRARERLARLQALRDIDRAIMQQLDLRQVLHVVLERVPEELGAEAIAICLLDERQSRPEMFVMRLPSGTIIEGEAFKMAESLLHWFVERQEPVVIYNLAEDPRLQIHSRPIRQKGLVSYLGVPLIVRERTIGILHILTTQPQVFAAEDVAFFSTLAGQAAIAIDNARAFAEATRRAGELEVAGDILRRFNISPDVTATFPEVAEGLQSITGCERVGLVLLDESREWFTVVALDRTRPGLLPETRLPLSEDLASTPAYADVNAGRPHLVPDLTAELDNPIMQRLHEAGLRSYISLPLHVERKVIGALNLAWRQPAGYNAVQLPLLGQLAEAMAMAMERSRLSDETRRRAAHLEALNAIIAAAAAATDLPDLLEIALEHTLRALKLETGAIWVGDQHAARGLPPEIKLAMDRTTQAAGLPIHEMVVVEDWQAEMGEAPHAVLAPIMARFGIQASLATPIAVEGQPIGGLSLAVPEPRAWSPDEVALVEAVGRQLGGAVERARLFANTQEHAELMGRLQPLSEALNRPHSLPEVLEAIGQGTMTLSGADRAALYLRNPDETVACPWSRGLSPAYVEQVISRARELPGGRLFEQPEPLLIPDVVHLPEDSPVHDLARMEGYRALAFWPLVYEGQVGAAVGCYYDAPHTWSEAEQEVMQAFARQAAVALENARLFETLQSRVDELAALAEASVALRSAVTVQGMAAVLAEEAAQLVQADAGLLCLMDEARQRVVTVGAAGLRPEAVGRQHDLEEGITGRVIQTGTTYRSSDLARDPTVAHRDLVSGLGPGLCVPLRTTAGEVVGTLLVGRRRDPKGEIAPFRPEEERLLTTLAEMAGNAVQRARYREELEEAYVQTVLALANAMDARDTYTGDHSQRLAAWAEATAQELGCNEDEIETIRWGALLHDIGKIGVPDSILQKPGKLDDQEWEVIKRHPAIGAEIVAPVKRLADVAPIIRAHQEHWDGKGYPDRLEGDTIPLGARILAVVDAYGAIVDERPYKRAHSHEEAVAQLKGCAGTQFDPQVVEAFLRVLERDIDITGGGGR